MKILKNNKEKKEKAQEIVDKLPENKIMCKEILEIVNNDATNIILDNQTNSSYYVFLNDTIYLSDKEQNKSGFSRVCLIAHECIHSIQNKAIQYINFVLSNLEILSFILLTIFAFLKMISVPLIYAYLAICVLSIVIRSVLEIDAIKRAIPLSKKYMITKASEDDAGYVEKIYKAHTVALLPIFFINLFYGKLLRIGMVILLNTYVK